jgi:anti-sigma factor RsiW
MMHPQIEREEVIERYVRNQLTPDERQAFEEHFFTCEECFENLQATDRFVAGIRDAGSRGLLGAASPAVVPAPAWRPWTLPAFVVSACAAVVLAIIVGLAYFSELAALRRQLDGLSRDLRNESQARAALENEIASARHAQANLPLVMLQATRGVQSPSAEVTLADDAPDLVLWIEPGAENSRVFRIQIFAPGGRLLQTVDGLKRNAYGALAVSLPARDLQPGDYKITLSAQEPVSTPPLGEYRLRIRRP